MRSILFILFALFSTAINVCAQDSSAPATKGTFSIQYSISLPMGNTSDFIEKTSFRGITMDYRYNITPQFAVGASAGWNVFYEKKDYDTYTPQQEGPTISGTQYRYINSVPLLVVADYYLKSVDEGGLNPFIGLGVGTTYNRGTITMSVYALEEEAWHLTVAPEVGLRAGKEQFWGYFSARYNNSFETSTFGAQSFLTFNLGLMYGL